MIEFVHHNSRFFAEKGAIEFSLVCAVYNERETLKPLLEQITDAFAGVGSDYELVLVDDGSSDGSLEALKDLIGTIPNLRVVELYRNVGQLAALSAGMSVARGRRVIMMDADLQHDPKDLPRFLEKSREGYDLVASYRERREEKLSRRIITALGNRINRYVVGVDIRDFGSAYRLIDANILLMITDANGCVHYNTSAIYKNARSVAQIPITQHRREFGTSKWSFWDFVLFNLDIITESVRLTQIVLYISGFGCFVGAMLYLLHILGVFTETAAISAPVSIAFTSVTLAMLAVIWRELISNQKAARNLPPFLISTVWSHDDDDRPSKAPDTTAGGGDN